MSTTDAPRIQSKHGRRFDEEFRREDAAPVLLLTFGRFPLTRLAYILIALPAVILLVGAPYTYEHVPFFDRLRARFHLQRNAYNRPGPSDSGDPFDPQKDMFCALVGASAALLLLSRLHNRELRRINPSIFLP